MIELSEVLGSLALLCKKIIVRITECHCGKPELFHPSKGLTRDQEERQGVTAERQIRIGVISLKIANDMDFRSVRTYTCVTGGLFLFNGGSRGPMHRRPWPIASWSLTTYHYC